MKKLVIALSAILATGFAFTSCSSDDAAPAEQVVSVKLVAEADFQFSSNGNVLATTLNQTKAAEVKATTEDVVLALVKTPHVEANLNVSDSKTGKGYQATHLSLHLRDANDVTVTLPVSSEFWTITTNNFGGTAANQQSGAIGNHGQNINEKIEYKDKAEFSKEIAGTTVKVSVSYNKEANTITVKTEGMNQDVLNYCQNTYKDGLTVEVWNYYNEKAATADLFAALNAKATIALSTKVFVNAFAKVNKFTDKVISKTDSETGFNTPCDTLGNVLPAEYWERATKVVGDSIVEVADYILLGVQNASDCAFVVTGFEKTYKFDANKGAANFNVVYYNQADFDAKKIELEK